ncbi:hypothetical protein ABZ864_45450 [Streptomyces sp. NPDC047082]|uniref:hypothetical protein n=1 Tax=Streptomyces sp. NPDC047082 TaxID=3155259 RepID=UPI0033F1FF7C
MTFIRGIKACAVAVAVSALAAGCGGSTTTAQGKDEPSVKGTPFGRPVSSPAAATTADPTITPSPSDGAPLIGALKYELRQRTVKMAGAPGRTSARCDRDSVAAAKGSKITCTVTYEGIKVTWPVTIEGPAMGGLEVKYQAKPSTGILTKKGAQAHFWNEEHDYGSHLRCDDMPALKTVPLGKKTGYRCTYLTKSETDGRPLWIPEDLTVRDDGPYFIASY